MGAVDRIFSTLARQGGEMYGGEAVTQLAHALQCAALAESEGADEALVVAALLHDYGHMVAGDEGAAEAGRDLRHEDVAADTLAQWFGPDVTEPIRLHVAAKRYLCAVDEDYFATLSPASVTSLHVQGGPFSKPEAAAFIAGPYGAAAAWLRRWDDLAKDPQAETPPLSHYRAMVERQMRARK